MENNNDNSHDDNDDDDVDADDQSRQRERRKPLLVASCNQLESFHEDVQYLWTPPCGGNTIPVQVYDEPPSSFNFLRNHVSVSRPCIIRNSILVHNDHDDDGSSTRNWNDVVVPLQMTLDDLVQQFPDNNKNDDNDNDESSSLPSPLPLLTVDVTPDGHGDCLRNVVVPSSTKTKEVTRKVFVKPLEREMTLSTFRRHLRRGRHKQQQRQQQQRGGRGTMKNKNTIISNRVFLEGEEEVTTTTEDDQQDTNFLDDSVLYYSRQNDCLREELSPLWNAKVKSQFSLPSSDNDYNDNNSSCRRNYVFPRSFPWAEEAFSGQPPQTNTTGTTTHASTRGPDACNIWIGDERVVSSMHKDYYENLFYVLSGEKVFHLCPPSDVPFLYEQEFMSGRFQHQVLQDEDDGDDGDNRNDDSNTNNNKGKSTRPRRTRSRPPRWTVALDRDEEEEDQDAGVTTTSTAASSNDEHENESRSNNNKKYSKVHWIAADPFGNDDQDDDSEEDQEEKKSLYPLSKYAHPMTVKVKAGELLYLPSLWFHRVTQTCETIGINYWYDMNFESPMYCYFHLLQQLQTTKQNNNKNNNNNTDCD